MIYHLPTIRTGKAGFEQLAALAAEAGDLFADRLEVDFSRCGFFDANMAAPLAAVLTGVADHLNTIEVVNVSGGIQQILRKNRFLLAYGYEPADDHHHTTLPFVRLPRAEAGRFADYLSHHMAGKGMPHMSLSLDKVFRQSIFEIFQNAAIHADSRLGVFVCGQFYPQLQRFDLTIADAGIGIQANVQEFLQQDISSTEAIRWALEEGHSTKTGPQPGGVGLKFLKDFVELNRGKIHIASRLGFYELANGGESFFELAADFPGTAVNLEINTGDTNAYCLRSEISPADIF